MVWRSPIFGMKVCLKASGEKKFLNFSVDWCCSRGEGNNAKGPFGGLVRKCSHLLRSFVLVFCRIQRRKDPNRKTFPRLCQMYQKTLNCTEHKGNINTPCSFPRLKNLHLVLDIWCLRICNLILFQTDPSSLPPLLQVCLNQDCLKF